jgi:hypothetical protein
VFYGRDHISPVCAIGRDFSHDVRCSIERSRPVPALDALCNGHQGPSSATTAHALHNQEGLKPFDSKFAHDLTLERSRAVLVAEWPCAANCRRVSKQNTRRSRGVPVKRIIVAAFVVVPFLSQPVAAQSYPSACTGSYRFTTSCCKASYGANAEGRIQNSVRIAALERCSLDERAAERAAKKKK